MNNRRNLVIALGAAALAAPLCSFAQATKMPRIGILFIGFFAQASWNGVADGWIYGNFDQLVQQAKGAVAAPIYAFVVTFILLKVIGAVMPLRGDDYDEAVGMDAIHHGEEAYPSGEGAILVSTEAGAEEPVESQA